MSVGDCVSLDFFREHPPNCRHPERGNLFPSRTGITSEGQVYTTEIIRVCSHKGYTHSTTTVPQCFTVSAQGDCLPLGLSLYNVSSQLCSSGTFLENTLPNDVTLSERSESNGYKLYLTSPCKITYIHT